MSGSFVPMNLRPIVFVDLETTGLDCHTHEILEFAAVRTDPEGREQAYFEHRVIPEHIDRASPEALQVNGYTESGWFDAVPLRVALVDYAQILGADEECITVIQNPVFDMGFIREAVRKTSSEDSASSRRS